jgi:DNA-binding SARP family transcriptional activator/tetratricopeptide (TPR) repeat protein
MSYLRLSIIGDCTIEVEDNRVTPRTPHVFALLLLLAVRQGTPISRQELQTLLVGDPPKATLARHSLRQLLYRLRRMGLCIEELSSGLMLCETDIAEPMDLLRRMDPSTRSRLTLPELEILPSYLPRLPKAFSIWLGEVRDDVQGQIRELLLADLELLHASHAWRDLIRLCEMLSLVDPANTEVVRARAEALTMTGRKEEALQVIDQFSRDIPLSADATAMLQAVRSRITKTTIARREGTLRARASCLTFLDAEWGKLPSEGARLSALIGHAGLGKTRVADEFATRVSFRGAHVVRFDCDSQSHQQPLALFSHILPSLRAMRGSLGASPEYKVALGLVRPTADSTEPALPEFMSLEARRADIQSALIDLLEAVTLERPLLLVVDDAHLLDDASRSVLRALTTTRNAARVQVLVCARPSPHNATLLAPAKRSSIFELAPLSPEDSRELLLELSADNIPGDEYVAWSLAQAAGNPFYLHQLAAHPSSSPTSLPFDISSLALSSYSSLRPESRAVLETCLLLGRFATMGRAVLIAGIDDRAMLDALRELEERDLVYFADGHLSGPHALLHDALRLLIPTSVAALLHRRIAARLEEDCVADQFTTSLAWASALSWLAAAEPAAATHLLRRCAGHAASLGEPAAGAELLSQVPLSAIPLALQGELLDDLERLANAGGSRAVAVAALNDRLRLARELGEPGDQLKSLELRIIESNLLNGSQHAPAAEELAALLADTSVAVPIRAQAGTRLLVLADVEFDTRLAAHTRACLRMIESRDEKTREIIARADLVYHTTFGDVDEATTLAMRLLAVFPEPSTLTSCMNARSYAALAFSRMGNSEQVKPVAEADYNFLMARRIYGEALYTASLRTEAAIVEGDFDDAALWLAKSEAAARGVSPRQLSPSSGYYANAGILAMRQGRYDEAEEYLLAPKREASMLITSARHRAVSLAYLLRIQQLRCDENLSPENVAQLHELYHKGGNLGGQDQNVEALWCAVTLNGDVASASELLTDYLLVKRRGRSTPEWSLRHATAADEAWRKYYSRPGAPLRPL